MQPETDIARRLVASLLRPAWSDLAGVRADLRDATTPNEAWERLFARDRLPLEWLSAPHRRFGPRFGYRACALPLSGVQRCGGARCDRCAPVLGWNKARAAPSSVRACLSVAAASSIMRTAEALAQAAYAPLKAHRIGGIPAGPEVVWHFAERESLVRDRWFPWRPFEYEARLEGCSIDDSERDRFRIEVEENADQHRAFWNALFYAAENPDAPARSLRAVVALVELGALIVSGAPSALEIALPLAPATPSLEPTEGRSVERARAALSEARRDPAALSVFAVRGYDDGALHPVLDAVAERLSLPDARAWEPLSASAGRAALEARLMASRSSDALATSEARKLASQLYKALDEDPWFFTLRRESARVAGVDPWVAVSYQRAVCLTRTTQRRLSSIR